MKISALINTYNSAETIARAIDSVLQQTRPADEVIVVDDGSCDDTCNIVSGHYPQVRLIQRVNGGPAAARNSGLWATQGDWIAMLDGDDQWFPEKLARIEVAATQHPEASVFFSSVLAIEGDQIRERIGCPEWVLGVEELLRGCPILTPSSAVVRASAVKAIGGFNETQRDGEDWEFWLRMASQGPLRRVAGPLAVYYLHSAGYHNRYVQTRKQATRFVLREGLRHIRRNGAAAAPALWEALGEHFKAFTYYASLQRNVGLTLTTGLAATLANPLRGGYAATRSVFRAVTGL